MMGECPNCLNWSIYWEGGKDKLWCCLVCDWYETEKQRIERQDYKGFPPRNRHEMIFGRKVY